MNEMVGPMGFTDMDHEGMLVEGFDELGTMATIYNYPYYPEHMERMGYVKDTDWVEYRITVPDAIPEKHQRIADIVAKKYGLRTIRYKSRKKLAADYGVELFKLINEAYDDLYGYSPLTDRQIQYYIDKYLSVLRLDCVSLVVDSMMLLWPWASVSPHFPRRCAVRRASCSRSDGIIYSKLSTAAMTWSTLC